MQIEDRAAVVTGGASGIGRGIALALGARGAKVVVADLEGEGAESVAAELRALGVEAASRACDVRRESEVAALADFAWSEFGRVDMVFNNAGVVTDERGLGTGTADLRWLLDVNVLGVWHGCSVFGRRFLRQDRPSWICNTASEYALGVPSSTQPFYTATKLKTGRSAEEVGEHTVTCVQAEEFLIVTHAHDLQVAEERWMDVRGAFERQKPPGDPDRDTTLRAIRDSAAAAKES